MISSKFRVLKSKENINYMEKIRSEKKYREIFKKGGVIPNTGLYLMVCNKRNLCRVYFAIRCGDS